MKLILRTLSSYVKNLHDPICINCAHFIKYSNNCPTDFIPVDKMGNCIKFGNKNLVTGEIKYDYAFICRKDIDKCGEEGRFFKENITISKQSFLKSNQ